MNAPNVYIEIRESSLYLLTGDVGLEVPLVRQPNGRLDPASRERLTSRLGEFLKQHGAPTSARAYCAIGARGVSLRRMTLPAASSEDLHRLLLLQIEREFPVSPEELAWGYRRLALNQVPGDARTESLLVVAVKKDLLHEYAEILSGCGLTPLFNLAALARSYLIPQAPASYSLLDIGRNQSELIAFDNGAPSSIRVLPWGEESFSDAGMDGLPMPVSIGRKIFLTGSSAALRSHGSIIAKTIGQNAECEPIETAPREGHSAAILGLKRACEQGGEPPVILALDAASRPAVVARPAHWKWAAAAALLLFVSVSLRYVEPLIQKPRLARKIASVKNHQDKLPNVDRELGFLQYLKTNQPPYLDSLFIMANAAPPGSRIETISMNRRGDLALRATLRDSQQVADFRTKLIGSGAFSSVVVDEQTAAPDNQKVLVRITGHWKPSGERKSSVDAPTPPPAGKTKKPGVQPNLPDGRNPSSSTNLPSTAPLALKD